MVEKIESQDQFDQMSKTERSTSYLQILVAEASCPIAMEEGAVTVLEDGGVNLKDLEQELKKQKSQQVMRIFELKKPTIHHFIRS